eukprot:Phypoly_transcript_10616.p1 GENE.Phypoly_transcript_10616~~Phypoly_transcript_10616.p1  ORF type:complete len:370 (+),score=45.47 Phypoly_transcript_10616:110-1219(+)
MLGHYVSQRGLTNLHTYKYSGVDNSLVAKYIMQPFWAKAVNLLPLWMAPNLVTLSGFVFILLSYFATSYYHPDLVRQDPPRWLYILNALCMFVYQTMDALDGKQARRTGSSSPLGELFDHGCDAVTTVVGAITLGCTLGVEKTLFLVAVMLMMLAFYFAQWEEYYTGTLTLGYIGVTEAQISAMVIYALSAALGPVWWDNVIHIAGWSVRYGSIPFLVSAASMIPTIASNFTEVFAFHRRQKGSKLSGMLLNAVPVVTVSAAFAAWAACSRIYHAQPQAFLVAYGFLVSNLVGRIVLARVCVERFQPIQSLLVPLIFVPFLIHTPFEGMFLNAYCLVAVCAYFHFALSVIRDICDTLKIKCLSITKKVK